jgi:hypothetical protein
MAITIRIIGVHFILSTYGLVEIALDAIFLWPNVIDLDGVERKDNLSSHN